MIKNKIDMPRTVQALLSKETDKAWYLECKGLLSWWPKKLVNYDKVNEELQAPDWLLKKKFL